MNQIQDKELPYHSGFPPETDQNMHSDNLDLETNSCNLQFPWIYEFEAIDDQTESSDENSLYWLTRHPYWTDWVSSDGSGPLIASCSH